MYHAIAEQPAATTLRLSVRLGLFAAQLDVCQQGFTAVTFSRLCVATATFRSGRSC
jgi:hypothetical protein